MTNEEFEQKIRTSFENATPDIFDSIKADCKNVNLQEEGINMNKNNKFKLWSKKWGSLVAVFVLLVVATFSGGIYYSAHAEEANVTFDVNPSVKISLNKNNRVLEANPLNDDGKAILADMDLKNVDLDVAVNALLGSMVKNGYLSDVANSILVSVDGQNTEKANQIQNEISTQIQAYMTNNNLDSAILSQNIENEDKAIEEFANKYNISRGKAQYILEVVKAYPNHKAEDLVDLTINEINVLMQNASNAVSNIESNGVASQKAYISRDSAIQIALQNAGLNNSNVRELEAEFDVERTQNGVVMVYEVEFKANNLEYDYDIDAISGEILYSKSAPMSQEDIIEDKLDKFDDDKYDDYDDIYDDDNIPQKDNYISTDEAKNIALKDAGFKANEVNSLKCELDDNNGKIYYEVEFEKGIYEYEYKLDPVSGSIINHKTEVDS